VGTPQTGGYGITLTGASTMIYYSNGYDLEKRQQSEARIDRIGQTKNMTLLI
jgi:SNF2 family DNA or RNA helicase